jgi:REP element-mobilizing transposase RayT
MLALQRYGRCGIDKVNVALGRYMIMPDHVHLFVRGGRNFIFSSWIGGLKRAISVAVLKEPQATRLPPQERRLWQPGFFDHVLRSDESYAEKWNYVRDNPGSSRLCESRGRLVISRRSRGDRSSVTVVAGVSPAKSRGTQRTRLPLQKMFQSDAGTHRTPKALRAKLNGDLLPLRFRVADAVLGAAWV